MEKLKNKFLLKLLYLLVYAKRALFFVLRILGFIILYIYHLLKKIFGLRVYKILYYANKLGKSLKTIWQNRIYDLIFSRSTLQFIIFVVLIFISFPHSNLYTQSNPLPGSDTLLFKIVGPGEKYSADEIITESVDLTKKVDTSWKEGAVVSNQNNIGTKPSDQEIGTYFDGTAIAKPNIIPGATLGGNFVRSDIIYHEVKNGETIGTIAENYGVSQASILWANNLTSRSYIKPGDKLTIPPTSGVIHIVKKGDTLSKIAKLYSAKESEIVKFNKLKEDGTDIVIGEQLIIPDGIKPTPVTTPNKYLAQTGAANAIRNVATPLASITAPAGTKYMWPAGVRRITQYFGWRHTGLDIAGPIGTAIYATKAGKVTKSQCGWNGGYGCYIIIDHGGGITSLYGHNSKLYVNVGDAVEQGQVIAAMGSTGRSTGPHSHFEIRVNGVRTNPLKYIR